MIVYYLNSRNYLFFYVNHSQHFVQEFYISNRPTEQSLFRKISCFVWCVIMFHLKPKLVRFFSKNPFSADARSVSLSWYNIAGKRKEVKRRHPFLSRPEFPDFNVNAISGGVGRKYNKVNFSFTTVAGSEWLFLSSNITLSVKILSINMDFGITEDLFLSNSCQQEISNMFHIFRE